MIAVPLPLPRAKVRKVFEVDTLRLDLDTSYAVGLELSSGGSSVVGQFLAAVLSSGGICRGAGSG
jgi:hypothetical protein